jgi:glucose-1-phosphatase
MSALRAVAFDLGNVLVDVQREVLSHALGLDERVVDAGFFAAERHERLTVGELSAGAFLSAAAAALGVSCAAAEEAWRGMVRVSAGAAALVDDVALEVLAWSNTDATHFAALQDGLPPRLWERRALSYELGAKKPSPLFYERALERAGLPASAVLFLDDLEENVAAARALGIDTLRVLGIDEVRRALVERGLLRRRL